LQKYTSSVIVKEALDLLDREPRMDLVLMDIMMPVMDGYEAMKGDRDKCIPLVPMIIRQSPWKLTGYCLLCVFAFTNKRATQIQDTRFDNSSRIAPPGQIVCCCS